MDSNSTVVPNQQSSSWKREPSCVQEDHFAMATYNDNHSESDHSIAYPVFPGPRLRIDSRVRALPEHEKEQSPVSSSLQEWDLFHDSLVVSGAKSRPRNPWAAAGSVTLLSLLLLALVVIPLLHTDTLPKRETLTMLFVPPPAAASAVTTFRVPTPTYTSKSINVPAAMHLTQETPPPPVGTTGGVIGGVPDGLVGGLPGGVLTEVLNGTHSVPVLATTSPTPKRMRLASRVAESNLIHDVAPTYPAEAGRARIEGTVVLLAVIAKDGTVQDVRVESGLPVLAQAAINAVKQWRYKPYLLNGEPIEVDSQITINFTLPRG
jgi:periplasmic protein TonB